jgi:Lon protease-like protein
MTTTDPLIPEIETTIEIKSDLTTPSTPQTTTTGVKTSSTRKYNEIDHLREQILSQILHQYLRNLSINTGVNIYTRNSKSAYSAKLSGLFSKQKKKNFVFLY